jgi:hypothetical protein
MKQAKNTAELTNVKMAQAHDAPGGAKKQIMAFVVASSHRWN